MGFRVVFFASALCLCLQPLTVDAFSHQLPLSVARGAGSVSPISRLVGSSTASSSLSSRPLQSSKLAASPASKATLLSLGCAASSAASEAGGEVDFAKIGKWVGATVVQFAAISLLLKALDLGVAAASSSMALPSMVTNVACFFFFGFLAIRSRTFSILDNSRPTRPSTADEDWKDVEVGKEGKGGKLMEDVKRPSWMPPPLAFPIIWSTIGVLRAISSVMIYKATGSFFALPILAFIGHLCIGDTWNTINNVEKLKGTSAAGVIFVLASVYHAIFRYYQALPKAGMVLAPSGLWLSIATVLIWTIWDMNGREPFLPTKA